jgi:hypothetical protein
MVVSAAGYLADDDVANLAELIRGVVKDLQIPARSLVVDEFLRAGQPLSDTLKAARYITAMSTPPRLPSSRWTRRSISNVGGIGIR